MDDVVIETDDLTKIYPGSAKPAVDELNLAVHRGEIFGLLGPNGAGKTTTAGMLTARVVPTRGRALVGGLDVWKHPARAKRFIGTVSQTNTLDRALSARDNLYFHGRYFGMSAGQARARAQELLEAFMLADAADKAVAALSGGMAQRLMLARAMMHRPSILFLDEPTAGLDPQSRLALWEIVGELNEKGQTVFLTTHHMEEADRLCTRLAIVDHGKLLALDSPMNLKRSRGVDTSVTIAADGDLDALAKLLDQGIDSVSSTSLHDGTVRLGVKGTEGVLPLVFQLAERNGIAVKDISISEPTLETVFIDLTGKDLRE